MHAPLDTIADSIGLTSAEKSRLTELEGVVERTLDGFLECGRALAEIRNKRLYRQDFATGKIIARANGVWVTVAQMS